MQGSRFRLPSGTWAGKVQSGRLDLQVKVAAPTGEDPHGSRRRDRICRPRYQSPSRPPVISSRASKGPTKPGSSACDLRLTMTADDAIDAFFQRPDAEGRRRRSRPRPAAGVQHALAQRRIDEARRHHADMDAVVGQLQTQAVVQAAHGELAGAVDGVRRRAAFAGQTADGDQGAVANA